MTVLPTPLEILKTKLTFKAKESDEGKKDRESERERERKEGRKEGEL